MSSSAGLQAMFTAQYMWNVLLRWLGKFWVGCRSSPCAKRMIRVHPNHLIRSTGLLNQGFVCHTSAHWEFELSDARELPTAELSRLTTNPPSNPVNFTRRQTPWYVSARSSPLRRSHFLEFRKNHETKAQMAETVEFGWNYKGIGTESADSHANG